MRTTRWRESISLLTLRLYRCAPRRPPSLVTVTLMARTDTRAANPWVAIARAT